MTKVTTETAIIAGILLIAVFMVFSIATANNTDHEPLTHVEQYPEILTSN